MNAMQCLTEPRSDSELASRAVAKSPALSRGEKLTYHIAPGAMTRDVRTYHRICRALASAGFRVSLIANGDENGVSEDGIQVSSLGQWSIGAGGWPARERLPRCRRAYRRALESKADIFGFYTLEFVPWAASLRKRTKKPVVFDCMEDFESYALLRPGLPKFLRYPLSWLIGAALRNVAGKIDAMVFSDAGTAKRFENHARETLVMHNFPDLLLFRKPQVAEQEKVFDITFHGGFHPHILQGCLAIDGALAARNRRLRWRLIGYMPLKEWFVGELRKQGAADRFTLLDLLPHDQVALEVSKAKVGVIPLPNLPKYQNNLPQKLFEFMALEMPVVLSDLPPSRPFASDNRCAFMVRPDDPDAYAEAIIRLVDNPELRRTMGAEGRRRVEERYNWQREAARLVELYDRLLTRHRRRK